MDSEGFYMLEHLLLKPSFKEPQYGFEFADQSGQVLIRQLEWQSFAQREETISAILELAALYTPDSYPASFARLQELCIFSPFLLSYSAQSAQQLSPAQQNQEGIAYLFYNLRQFALRSTDIYPSFKFTVKPADSPEIAEDFFNFRMTVVFPSWPARFQDTSFRELAEDLFREECPAHMKLSFLWLSIRQMEVFDGLYFDWLNAVKEDGNMEEARSLAQKLSQFLIIHLSPEDKP